MTVNHDVVGSSPAGGAKNPRSSERGFFICAVRHNIICVAHATSFDRRSTSLPLAAQMNEVALRANDVMLRINDVALRANGTEHLSHIGATILPPNTKALDFGGLFVFLGVKNTPPFTIAPFPRPFGLEPATFSHI